MSRQPFGRRINAWLAEAPAEQFTDNKWRFWFLTLVGFQLLNATLTSLVFNAGGQLQNAMGAIVLAVGALLAWLAVAFLHYSDSTDRRLARGVSLLDSITLVCVLAHFTFLLWTFGHLRELQRAESEYKATAKVYNERAEKISADNAKIAASAERIAEQQTKRARLENDTAYQQRRAVERGLRIPGSRSAPATIGPALSTAQIELERPKAPAERSTAFLTRWDFWIRAANLAELLLAAATLIYIRNRSAKTNTPHVPEPMNFDSLLPVAARQPTPRPAFAKTHVSFKQEKTPKTHVSFNLEGLKRLRETLRDISFRLAGISFKADVKPEGCVWIRAMRANAGTQETTHSVRAKLSILDDAASMERNAFRERLERFLKENGFEI